MPNHEPIASRYGPLQPLALDQEGETAPDALLLDRFIKQWDHEAFRDLVGRHGPMVLGVCRRILRDHADAEDVFQATFLLLVRKAGSVRKRESVGPWLYGVAQRVALEARGAALRRPVPVPLDAEVPGVDELDGLEHDELLAALHEELGRLPEKYREPLVLCYIEGLPHEAVARQLGWPLGTVRTRIARGRDLLAARLTRRGLAPAAVLLALGLIPKTEAAVPPRLVEATLRAAARVAAGEPVPRGEVPARVIALERKVRKSMNLIRLKWLTALALGAVVTGAGLAVLVPTALAAAADAADVSAELKKLQGTWVPVSVEVDGANKDVANAEQLEFDGETFNAWHNGHVDEKGTITLDPSSNPKQIDLKVQGGTNDGKAHLAIYAWDGANLKFCMVKEGHPRPTDFTTKPGDNRFLLVMKRQEP